MITFLGICFRILLSCTDLLVLSLYSGSLTIKNKKNPIFVIDYVISDLCFILILGIIILNDTI